MLPHVRRIPTSAYTQAWQDPVIDDADLWQLWPLNIDTCCRWVDCWVDNSNSFSALSRLLGDGAAHTAAVAEAVGDPSHASLLLKVEGFSELLPVVGHEADHDEEAEPSGDGNEADAVEASQYTEGVPPPVDAEFAHGVRPAQARAAAGPECDVGFLAAAAEASPELLKIFVVVTLLPLLPLFLNCFEEPHLVMVVHSTEEVEEQPGTEGNQYLAFVHNSERFDVCECFKIFLGNKHPPRPAKEALLPGHQSRWSPS